MTSDKPDVSDKTPAATGTDSPQALVCQVLDEMKASSIAAKSQDKAPQSALDEKGALTLTPLFPVDPDPGFIPKAGKDTGGDWKPANVGDPGFTPKGGKDTGGDWKPGDIGD